MRLMFFFLLTVVAQPTLAQARVEKYQKLIDQLKSVDPLNQAERDRVAKVVNQADAAIQNFSELKVQRSDEFASLVTLAGYSLLLGSFNDSAEVIDGIREGSPDLQSAYEVSVKALDHCRRENLRFRVKIAGDQGSVPSASFNYADCVAKHPAKKKH